MDAHHLQRSYRSSRFTYMLFIEKQKEERERSVRGLGMHSEDVWMAAFAIPNSEGFIRAQFAVDVCVPSPPFNSHAQLQFKIKSTKVQTLGEPRMRGGLGWAYRRLLAVARRESDTGQLQ